MVMIGQITHPEHWGSHLGNNSTPTKRKQITI